MGAYEKLVERAVAEIENERNRNIAQKAIDMVNRPPHYAGNGVECIDSMISAYGKDVVICFCQCNAFKYIWRSGKKNGVEDLEKAKWYINKMIELLNEQ